MKTNIKFFSRDLSKHLPHYASLFGVIFLAIIGFYLFSWDRAFQVAILFGVAASYVCWGIVHHSIHKNLSLPIVIEYFVVAILGLSIVLSLIFQS